MRIYGNRLLKTLPGQQTRPTTGKVRMALFNIWRGEIRGCHWLDLCAGNGTLGAEALCRGAEKVVAIEQSPKVCAIIRENWQKIAQIEQKWAVLQGNVLTLLPDLQGQNFDRIYFDPPYGSGLYDPVLDLVGELGLLDESGEMAVEYDQRHWQPPERIAGLELIRQKKYGLSNLAFYWREQGEALPI
ncbi:MULTISPECIES: 16S rRNA (guanine(966)-N(2))-methyltransferase RsmD [unclassified Synechocystis]|uniref:16S rRNA (guanine(966)-N(2))-methyltransferase RsmD n=1 Tax=unclassified Synechocystis TaxID=2640012 RepID=UPI0003F981E2|nr:MULTISPECIES: 16S rRNA (guanine(966)-N(2))-methyltransferase RsmD [unclassified Synechocystis]AIE73772.1 16S rRNA (guanine(966)-N(2))-methyltransferase SSU rRNA m(2)G966 [Synechocystis sp. PCC 6714]MCT0252402.1 16S rRNA (guanine(966)-N(2))-methyltransferase RsmD [Synechocystis sp. CS-94]